jgi:hypothetical protein
LRLKKSQESQVQRPVRDFEQETPISFILKEIVLLEAAGVGARSGLASSTLLSPVARPKNLKV